MAIYNIKDEEKDFVGIGKMMIDSGSSSYNIPHLHFLVYRNYKHFEAICLELGLITVGSTPEESAERLVEHTNEHIKTVMSDGGGFEELKDAALNEFLADYWPIYHHIEFRLAETGHDLSHKLENIVTKAAIEMLEANFEEFIKTKAEELADEIIAIVKEYKKNTPAKNYTYASLETAA